VQYEQTQKIVYVTKLKENTPITMRALLSETSHSEVDCDEKWNWRSEVIDNNLITTQFIVVLIVITSIVFELVTHKLEHHFSEQFHVHNPLTETELLRAINNQSYRHEIFPRLSPSLPKRTSMGALNKVYKELMILGFISFMLFWAQQLDVVAFMTSLESDGQLTPAELKQLFEFVHTALFCIMIFYVLLISLQMLFGRRIKKYWQRIEISYDKLKDEQSTLKKKGEEMNRFLYYINIYHRIKLYRNNENLNYHCIRNEFLDLLHIPREDFTFRTYLSKNQRVVLLDLIEIHSGIWVILLVLIVLNLIRMKVFSISVSTNFGITPFIVLGWVLFLISLLLFLKCKWIVYKLLSPDGPMNQKLAPADALVNHKKLFFFSSPKFTLRCIQSVLFFQSIYVTLYILVFAIRVAVEEHLAYQDKVFYSILMITPPIFTVLVLLPEVLPLYTIANCVGSLTRKDLVLMTQQLDSPVAVDWDLVGDGEDEPSGHTNAQQQQQQHSNKEDLDIPIKVNDSTLTTYYQRLDIEDDERKAS